MQRGDLDLGVDLEEAAVVLREHGDSVAERLDRPRRVTQSIDSGAKTVSRRWAAKNVLAQLLLQISETLMLAPQLSIIKLV